LGSARVEERKLVTIAYVSPVELSTDAFLNRRVSKYNSSGRGAQF